MDCEIVEHYFTSKSDIDYKEKCNKKIVDLRDYWIKEATDQHHPKGLMSMAHLQSAINKSAL